jgi:shikimate-5-dehydrogenase
MALKDSNLPDGEQIPLRNFYIFGQGISFSMSPTIHNASFRYYNLPYTYAIHEAATVDELSPLIFSPNFGGASITTPHKVEIMKFCSSISDHAKNIGAANTLIRDETSSNTNGNVIRGDNTDWKGLVGVLENRAERLSNKQLKTALVIGAGGASRAALYALYQFGCDTIYLSNRTRSTAEELAQSFASVFKITVVDTFEDFSNDGRVAPDILIGTIPADKTTIDSFPRALFAKPEGVCVDMSYNPRYTPLLAATERYGEGRWGIASGIDVLLEQAFTQFRLFTGREAPREVMWDAVEKRDAEKKASDK